MKQSLFGFVAGWFTMSVLVMGLFVAGPALLGVERVFEPGRWEATPLWIGLAMGIGFVGGAVGAWVGVRVGRGRGPAVAMGLVMLVAGAVALTRPAPAPQGEPPARPEGLSFLEAMEGARQHGREPLVTRITNPLAGILGVALGAALALGGARRRDA